MHDDTTRGAMPRPGAMLEPAGRTGGPISWPRVLRDAEGNQSGANGGSAAATPAGTTTPPASATPAGATPTAPSGTTPGESATDYPDGLGDAGKRAIDAMKASKKAAEDRAVAAEKERDDLRAATQTDQEKALSTAKREAEAAERTKWTDRIRATEVRSTLRSAGVTNDKALGYLATAPAFGALKVADDGSVTGLDEAVATLKKDMPEAFAPKASDRPGGAWDGAAGGSGGSQPPTLAGAVMDRLKRT